MQKFKAFTLIEVLLSVSILAVLVTFSVGAIVYINQNLLSNSQYKKGVYLAEEGLEAVKNIKDVAFTNLTDGNFTLETSYGANKWVLSAGTEIVDNFFTRQITISTLDTNSKQVESVVSYPKNTGGNVLITFSQILTNFAKTVLAIFNNPIQSATLDISSTQDGLRVATEENYAYLIRNNGSPDFVIVDMSNLTTPTIVSSLSIGRFPTNIFVSGNYAYVTGTDNNNELTILDITNKTSPSIVGSFNDSGTEDSTDVYVSGNYAYVTLNGGNEFVVVNVTNKSSPTLAGVLNFASALNRITILGNYAYVTSTNNTNEVSVVNITNPASPSVSTNIALAGNNDALAIDAKNNLLAISRTTSGGIYLYNITNPASPVSLSNYNFTSTINEIYLNETSNTLFGATSNATQEFIALDITNTASPALLSSLNLTATLNGITYNSTSNAVFGASADNATEFIVITTN